MALIRRVAFLSLHTSPLEQPGSGEAGGMNVYIRSLASALASTGVEVDIFTRSAHANRPAVEHPDTGVRVHSIVAGPGRTVAKEELPELLHSMVAVIDRTRQRQPFRHYDLIHSHYWISGVAGLELSRQWNVPLVHTMHTMAKAKSLVLQPGEKPEPRRREDGEHRIVDGATRLIANTRAEAAELVSYYGADLDGIDVAPPGVDLSTFTPAFRGRARAARAIDALEVLEVLHDDPTRRRAMGRAAAVQAESSDWPRTAAMTARSYRTATQRHSARSELLASNAAQIQQTPSA